MVTWHIKNMAAPAQIEYQKIDRFGVDAHVLEDVQTPMCTHGPTVVFERFFKDKPSRRFFACSASRDRKGCPFFQWEDEKITAGKQILLNEIQRKIEEDQNEMKRMAKKRTKHLSAIDNLFFCCECNQLFGESSKEHITHKFKRLSRQDVCEPSRFMHPVENKKTNAQYLFSETSCKFITNMICKMEYEKIICLGVPRIHEMIQKLKRNKSLKQESILLDIDKRYGQFLPESEFIYYNMFNNYFFGGEVSKQQFKTFIGDAVPGKIVLVMDPPFGGFMSVLAASINNLLKVVESDPTLKVEDITILMIFPYYLESHVTGAFSILKMMDYKISYENHPNFKPKTSEFKRGSPIRIFTNIPGKEFVLPKKEGYQLCEKCERFVAEENKHCEKCDQCTSKDGRTYVHCDECGKCVKPGRVHCLVCQRCEFGGHKCGFTIACHICGEEGHKRNNCPKKVVKSLKRPSTRKSENRSKKLKTSKKAKKTKTRV